MISAVQCAGKSEFYSEKNTRFLLSSFMGNALDHYDTALYGLLAPIIAPLIFQDTDPVSRLILTYGLMSTAFITRPLGSWLFGKIAYTYDARKIFAFTLLGIAFTTVGMGLLPSHSMVGSLAPILLASLRLLQGFFAAGESTIAPLLVLQHTDPKRFGFSGSVYQSSIVLGILLASALSSVIYSLPDYEHLWRLPFLLGSLTAIVGWFIRFHFCTFDKAEIFNKEGTSFSVWSWIKKDKMKFIRIILASSFTYMTYSVPFVFFNVFVPLVSSVSSSEMLAINTGLLALDMVLVPIFGLFADRYKASHVMFTSALLLASLLIPFFIYLPSASLLGVSLIRISIVILGLIFLAPLQGWFYQQYGGDEKYALIGLGYAIGSELFGRSLPAVCLWIWKSSGWVAAPAIYLSLLSLLTTLVLLPSLRRNEKS
ncbi:MAG: MFS transporter [Oligoflexales bacterium]|nr:MFS transporter [Oligoflexales bacterium]